MPEAQTVEASKSAGLGKEPISGKSPAGASARLEPEFEKLQAEIAKLDSLQGQKVDWGGVVSLSTSILKTKSKDLLAACYLCMGLFETRQWAGLSEGLSVLRDMTSTFWDTMYPEKNRLRGREGAYAWLLGKLEGSLKENPPPVDGAGIKTCSSLIEDLGGIIVAKIPNTTLDTRVISKTLQELQQPAPAQEQAQAPAAPKSSDGTNFPDARKLLLGSLPKLREAKPASPLPYQVARVLLWGTMEELPANTEGITAIPGVDSSVKKQWDLLLEKSEYASLLTQIEVRLPTAVWWLDLNWYVHRALTGLGYQRAAQVLADELALVCKRLPGILELKFQNGVPFADERTRIWVQNELLRPIEKPLATVQSNDPLKENEQKARKLATQGKLSEALNLFQSELKSVSSRREKFSWRLSFARLLMESGQTKLALPQLETLDEEIRQFSLEEWDPGLCVDVTKLLLQAIKLVGDDGQKGKVLFSRLARLDAPAALAWEASKGK